MNPQKTIYSLLVLLIISLPLFLNVYSDSEFTFNKTSVSRLFILVAVAVSFYFYSSSYFDFKKCWRECKSYFILTIFYLIAISLSTIFSQSHSLSFFGSERQQGWLQFVLYLLLFSLVLLILRRKQVEQIIFWITGISLIVSLVGILECFNIRPVWFPVYDQGVASTLGHPSFLGAYLVMVIPLTFALLIISSRRFEKYFSALTLIMEFSALILTKTRAAWFAFVLFLLFALIMILVKQKKKFLLAITGIILLIASFLVILTGTVGQFINAQDGSGALRTIWWNQAIIAIKGKPILGYGLETQKDVLMPAYQPLQGVYSYFGLRVDRAHNEVLDQLLTTGIVGTAAFFLLVVCLFKDGICSFFQTRDKKKAAIILALLGGILAYFIQGMFSFSVTVLYVYFWLYAGLLVVILVKENDKKDKY